jgi:hypothetical protein
MPSALTQRALQTIADTGFTRAKKLAALAIKTNTDSAGNPTARGYEQALQYLQPFIDSGKGNEAVDAQTLIAGYNNNLDKLTKKGRDQNETVAAFKLQELDSYFTSFDGDMGSFRDPSNLIDTTSQALDGLLLGVLNAIDDKEANGDSTDALYAYMNDLNKRADQMRDLRNKFQNGELTGQSLDGFGYYVDTNPMDGSIRGAALLPVGVAPDGLTSGYRRLEATANVGGALMPVYAPAQQDAMGEYTARVGDATWTGTGSGALQTGKATDSKDLFVKGGFKISDTSKYPVRKNSIDKGSFARGFIGKDTEGNPVEAIYYRGQDNKLYALDQQSLDQFKADPLLSKKLDGYIPQFSPTEMQGLMKEAAPFSESVIKSESTIAGFDQAFAEGKMQPSVDKKPGVFDRVKSFFGIGGGNGGEEPAPVPAPTPTPPPQTSFFQRNRPTTPEQPTVSNSGKELIAQGDKFFRSA